MFRFSLRPMLISLAVLNAYFAAYTALLRPVVVVDEGLLGMVVSGHREPDFKIGGSAARIVFSPAVCLDRTIRPLYWARFSDFENMPENSQ